MAHPKFILRPANMQDLPELLHIEQQSFHTDRLSRRSFTHLLQTEHATLTVAQQQDQLAGYGLVLYRQGTSLARLYSLAVAPQYRRMGIASSLLHKVQHQALEHNCHFLRLEVSEQNQSAVALYQSQGFYLIDTLPDYYADGTTGLRLEKPLKRPATQYPLRTYYAQTTPFTCGPASLLMAMHALDPNRLMNRQEELQLWREATTIYMTAGHGGCSAEGLALAAWNRGFQVSLYSQSADVPFIEGVRSEEKKSVLRLVHESFCQQLALTQVAISHQALDVLTLAEFLAHGAVALTLVSTWRLNRNKSPHWVMVSHADSEYFYLNDPDFDEQRRLSPSDLVHIPVTIAEFQAISQFGRGRLKATLVLHS